MPLLDVNDVLCTLLDVSDLSDILIRSSDLIAESVLDGVTSEPAEPNANIWPRPRTPISTSFLGSSTFYRIN